MSTPVKSLIVAAEASIAAWRNAGWPTPDSPYDRLVTMEQRAARLTHIGGIPGALLDMAHVKALQRRQGVDSTTAERRNRLHTARQTLVAGRIATRSLAVQVLLGDGAINALEGRPPELRKIQVRMLLSAIECGWDIRAVDELAMRVPMLPETQYLIIAGEPRRGHAVYQEIYPHGERYSEELLVSAHAGYVYETVAKAAHTVSETHTLLERQLE